MSTLKAFSEKEHAYDAYQARQDYLRVQSSIQRRQHELEQALAQEHVAREAERHAKEAALQEKDAALAELARLQTLLGANQPRGGA
ncbi:hypothetical protein [uncultured Thiodictyon sp.]|uniref:hypothetical protein n=1 Tax=uncultured Thiodictyon sp. TaxID=1846217 RepID=UPI0025CE973C|nr:hypothetical protein [uncultured Thiodictyon sp.]